MCKCSQHYIICLNVYIYIWRCWRIQSCIKMLWFIDFILHKLILICTYVPSCMHLFTTMIQEVHRRILRFRHAYTHTHTYVQTLASINNHINKMLFTDLLTDVLIFFFISHFNYIVTLCLYIHT